MTDRDLVDKAFNMLDKAYIHYSHFPVGAALEGADGTFYTAGPAVPAARGSMSSLRTWRSW